MQLQALEQLADIYAAALRLPGVDYRSSPEPPRLQPDERKRIGANLRNLPIQYYWEVFTPSDLDGNKEAVCGDLFDDFLDIYADLADGLWLYDREHFEAAVFSWSHTFGFHWGRHAVSAMHALHSFEGREAAHEQA
jgi:hypothetical protein